MCIWKKCNFDTNTVCLKYDRMFEENRTDTFTCLQSLNKYVQIIR